tara:strand:- start:97 stop:507 length:411 start_codon:yes stop_codon:yes gene_type:complete
MKVKIKKLHTKAVIPKYAKDGDAGMDLTAVEAFADAYYITYRTGLSIEIPPGYVGLLFPRSSVYKKGQILSNSVGVIDSGYRGEIMLKFTRSLNQYAVGDRVGQIIILPFPKIEFEEVSQLSETNRASGGFGSTGD